MNARSSALYAFVIATVAPLSHAASDFYVGAAAGGTSAHSDYASQVTSGRGDPAPPTDISLDADSGVSGRIFAGMRVHPNFSLELDYADLGRLATHAMWHANDPIFQFERFGRIKVRAAGISLLASAPIATRTSVFARAGAAYTWVDYEVRGTAFYRNADGSVGSFPSPTPPNRTGNGTRGVLAAGIEHAFTDRWSLRAEYARYFDLGADYNAVQERGRFDLDFASVGVSYRF